MSLSMPTMSSPFRAKNRAASAPIRPAEPVIMAIAIRRSSSFQYRLALSAVLAQPSEDVVKYVAHRETWTPPGRCRHGRIVRDVERNVYWVGIWSRGDPEALASASYTRFREFRERHAAIRATP